VDFYWIPQQTIIDEGLPASLVGQNSIDAFHPSHVSMNLTHLVQVDTVPLLPIDIFLELYHIRRVQLLKIDTEGHDVVILRGLYEYLRERGEVLRPEVIIFESNALTAPEDVASVLQLFVEELDYVVRYRGLDTVLARDSGSVHRATSPS